MREAVKVAIDKLESAQRTILAAEHAALRLLFDNSLSVEEQQKIRAAWDRWIEAIDNAGQTWEPT